MVRSVTTAYTHVYANGYVGLPQERYRRRSPNDLADVGVRVERWRKAAGLPARRFGDRVRREGGAGQPGR